MGIFSRFEGKMEDTVEGAAAKMSKAPISPVQIAKKAEKQMRRETMVGAGKEYAPTLYTVLVNPDDDARMAGYYPTLAGETETYLQAKASQQGLVMDGHPLVRFIVDDSLKHGKFDIIAETVAAPIIKQLRAEEMERYGIAQRPQQQAAQAPANRGYGYEDDGYGYGNNDDYGYGSADGYGYDNADDYGENGYDAYYQQDPEAAYEEAPRRKPPLPYVPEEEIDRSIDYGEYTFNSEDFEDYRAKVDEDDAEAAAAAAAASYGDAPAQVQPANTVAFTPGQSGAAAPDHRAVRARLIDTAYQRVYDLAGSCVTIGRESGNDIIVQDINASRKHAELRLNARGLWVITDLGSMNGTRVNGISVASQPLYPGDTITIGKTEYRFALAN